MSGEQHDSIRCERANAPEKLLTLNGVKAVRRLIENQQLWSSDDRCRQRSSPPLTARKAAQSMPAQVDKTDLDERRLDAARPIPNRNLLEPGRIPDQRFHPHPWGTAGFLRQPTEFSSVKRHQLSTTCNVDTIPKNRPGGRGEQPAQRPNQRGLASTIPANQCGDPRAKAEAHSAENLDPRQPHLHAVEFNRHEQSPPWGSQREPSGQYVAESEPQASGNNVRTVHTRDLTPWKPQGGRINAEMVPPLVTAVTLVVVSE